MNNNEIPGDWVTTPAESDSDINHTIFVTGRTDVKKFRDNPRFNIRVEVTFSYTPAPTGMPDVETADVLEEITGRLANVFQKDPVAVLTGIYTGDNQRNWVFYTTSTHIFQRKFNESLSDLPLYPITISAENDPDWEEYTEMMSLFA